MTPASLEVVIIRTGSANLASVSAAFERLGAVPRITEDALLVASAPRVVLPGVGSFGAAMDRLRDRGLDASLRDRIANKRPLLAICLGMQVLCEASDESPGTEGLGIVPGRITRFDSSVRVPQMGWNSISPTPAASLLRADRVYFANSYRLARVPDGWEGARTDHGGDFASALERGPLLACQFHPELSGAAGLKLIDRWLSLAAGKESVPC
jgi:imidazole glycerol phosphate synthase glutamine amidotransferase subunit